MPKHYRVSPKFWKGDRRRWGDRKKLLALYLLTCEHRNLEGYYFLPRGYIQTDLGWPAKVVEDLVDELVDEGFVQYDDDAEVVLIDNALAHQAPSTENQIRGAIAALSQVPSSCLWDAFRMSCASHAPKLANAIDETWPGNANGSLAYAIRTHSSSSSSSSIPPQPPASGGQRRQKKFQEELRQFVDEHFPGVAPGLVAHQASQLRSLGREPTVEALRPLIEENAA